MKVIIAIATLVAVAVAAPATHQVQPGSEATAQVLKHDSDNIGVDGYNFAYETSNGIAQQESAQLQNVGSDHESLAVRGHVEWTGADGVHYSLSYLADENGFQPEGAHLPTVAP